MDRPAIAWGAGDDPDFVGVVRTRFDVVVGRTAYELVQIQTVIGTAATILYGSGGASGCVGCDDRPTATGARGTGAAHPQGIAGFLLGDHRDEPDW